MIIKCVKGREILDSRGFPTVYAEIETQCGVKVGASVPSGASVGKFEAVELRDGGARYGGKGVKKAVMNIQLKLNELLSGKEFLSQKELDDELCRADGTPNKSQLGANAILAVSLAGARALAATNGVELFEYLHKSGEYILPTPMMNILNGGAHADNNVDIQEFMIMPVCATSFSEAVMLCSEVYMALKSILKKRGLGTGVGDEGGFAPNLSADEQALDLLMEAMDQTGIQMSLALDAAASEWYKDGKYIMPKSKKEFDSSSLCSYFEDLVNAYPIVSLEDGMGEDDFEGWAEITKRIKIQLVGDDLFVTNTNRIKEGIERGMANSLLVKLNQIGTVSEARAAVEMVQNAGYTAVVSHRSGETEDTFIADFAAGLSCGQIKTGAPARSERTSKYNRLLAIEDCLGERSHYIGGKAIKA